MKHPKSPAEIAIEHLAGIAERVDSEPYDAPPTRPGACVAHPPCPVCGGACGIQCGCGTAIIATTPVNVGPLEMERFLASRADEMDWAWITRPVGCCGKRPWDCTCPVLINITAFDYEEPASRAVDVHAMPYLGEFVGE